MNADRQGTIAVHRAEDVRPSRRGELPESICLVIPPSVFLLDERVFVSLGILRVAAVLEQAGVRVEVVDLSGIENFLDAIEGHARVTRFEVRPPQEPHPKGQPSCAMRLVAWCDSMS